MNKRLFGVALALACVPLLMAQEPPGCVDKKTTRKHLLASVDPQQSEITGKLPKRTVLDLRKKKRRKRVTAGQAATDQSTIPVLASPIYLPQSNGPSPAMTASNGFLYILVGQKLYKVNEKTLKTVQVSQIGRMAEQTTLATEKPPRHRKIVASTDEEPVVRKSTRKHKTVKTD